jgi:hypothetical protein
MFILLYPFVVVQHDLHVIFEELLENVHPYLYEQNLDVQIHHVNNMDRFHHIDTKSSNK